MEGNTRINYLFDVLIDEDSTIPVTSPAFVGDAQKRSGENVLNKNVGNKSKHLGVLSDYELKFIADSPVFRALREHGELAAVEQLALLTEKDLTGSYKDSIEIKKGLDKPGYNVFSVLCLSSDSAIRAKATEVLFAYLEKAELDGWRYEVCLALFIDEERLLQIMEQRFWNLVDKTTELWEYIEGNVYPLGKQLGKDLWDTFQVLAREVSECSEHRMLVLEGVFRNASLTLNQKKRILFETGITEDFLRRRDYDGEYFARFQRLVQQCWQSAEEMTSEEKRKLGYDVLRNFQGMHGFVRTPRETLVPLMADLTAIGFFTEQMIHEVSLTDRFEIWSYNDFEMSFGEWLDRSGLATRFAGDGATIPADYVRLFERKFQPLLENLGIANIRVAQYTEKTGENEFEYTVYVYSEDKVYCHTYDAEGMDWQTPQKLVKMINMMLSHRSVKERLIDISVSDEQKLFALFEPGLLVPVLLRYGLSVLAVHSDDQFSTIALGDA